MEVKRKYGNALVFYRVGDFYELFGKDAETASKALDLTLTARSVGANTRVPMCGVPVHSSGHYIQVLINKGYKTAVCDPSN